MLLKLERMSLTLIPYLFYFISITVQWLLELHQAYSTIKFLWYSSPEGNKEKVNNVRDVMQWKHIGLQD